MLQSTATPATVVPRGLRSLAPSTPVRVPLVTLDVTVPGTSSAIGRQALHAALGKNLRLYVVTIDKRNERITFRVEVISRTLDEVIGALAGALDRAILGRAVESVIRRPLDLPCDL
ncbi:hypothetical protein P3T40_001520 [Paraburkholderia sp. EB58]|jgi:hypothetical protein|uniref:hypothetical protein n=1 Tax=Paraburkholderia sp. EB58 TaxID=3035125 RepID=UPI003D20BA57